ncbi:MAG: permease [Nitrospirae bacterium GWD2_57_9]|nr:MAG: permease [Nitrospirae bacterium GWD2_57_9]
MWDLVFNPHGILAELWDVLPYFLAGVLLAGYIRTYKIAVKMQAKLKRYGFLSIFVASFVGILTPLCACGTLTTAISLLFAGLPLAPVMALLVTSPLLSPSTYLLTLNDLGPEWTVIRTIAAFSMGIFAGVVTHLLRNKGFRTESVFIEGGIVRGDFHDEAYPDERLRCNCKEKFGNRIAVRTGNKFLIFLAKSWEMFVLVGKYVLVGVAIGAVVERYMPYDWIHRLFGREDPLNIVWITFGSVPVFLHQVSASSILYHIKSSLDGTLDSGAALAFMIGGPVTAVPTMVLFWTIFKKRVFFLYLFVCIAGTILLAYAFQFLVFVPYVDTGSALLRDVRSLSGGMSSIIGKENKNVRIVMDPDGNSMIATATNDLEGQGGIVFDGGLERLLDRSAGKYDNRKYIANIAAWLEENNTSPEPRNILIYDTFRTSGPDKSSFANLKTLLEQQGFRVRLTDRRETPEITGRLLEEQGQLWLLFGQAGSDRGLSDRELEAVTRFTSDGRGMLLAAGVHGAGADGLSAPNRIASGYGVTYSGTAQNADELPATTGSYFLHRASGILGKILKLVHKA